MLGEIGIEGDERLACKRRGAHDFAASERMIGGRNQEAVVRGDHHRRDAAGKQGLVIDDEVDLVFEEAHVRGFVYLAKLDFDIGVSGAHTTHPSRQDLLDLERAGLDAQAPCDSASSDGLHDVGQALEEGGAEGKQLTPGPRRHGAIFGDLLEQANAEVAFEPPHLRVNAGLRDGIRKLARRTRITAGRRHAKEAFELIQKNHSLTVCDPIKMGNWQSWSWRHMVIQARQQRAAFAVRQGAPMKPRVGLPCLLLIVTQALPASAEGSSSGQTTTQSPRPSELSPATVRHWYGYQTLISDALSTTSFAAGVATFDICFSFGGTSGRRCHDNTGPTMLLLGGMAGYALGGPVIHAVHGHWDKAGYSLGLRALPVAAAVGLGIGNGSGNPAGLLFLGAGAAMILDSALLGYETVAVDAPKVSVAPSFDPNSRTGSLVVAGTF